MNSYKSQFPRAKEVAYLDTAAEGLLLAGCDSGFAAYRDAKSLGTPGRRLFHQVEAETVELASRLLGAQSSNVAFLSCASEALCLLAASLDWAAGDEVVICETEFPSNVLPWIRLRNRGVRVIVTRAPGGALDPSEVLNHISPRTRLVSLSLVSYKTGAYVPFVSQLAAEVKEVGAVLSIDATQALGRCPVPLEGVDFLVSSTYKWLLGPHGLALVYISSSFREMLQPANLGWYSVANIFNEDRFDRYELKSGAACIPVGMPNFPGIYALRDSIRFLLTIGPDAIFQDLGPAVVQLRQGLERLDCDLLTPVGPEYASGIVSFGHADAEQIGAALEREGVIVWAGDGRVRASVHLYNDMQDIEFYLDRLSAVLRVLEFAHA